MAELVITKKLPASKEDVFNAWAQSANMQQWWGPKGYTATIKEFNFALGGRFHYCFGADGIPGMWGLFEYRQITAPDRIVFINSFSDNEGTITRAPFSATWPLYIMNEVTLAEADGFTTLTLRGKAHDASNAEVETFEANFDNMQKGFGDTFNRLETFLAKEA